MPISELVNSYIEATEVSLLDWTVADLLQNAVASQPERIAIKEPGLASKGWTYTELKVESLRAGRALLNVYKPKDRVGVWAANQMDWVLLQMGAAYAGITLVTMNPANRGEEISYLLGQSKVSGLFMEKEFRGLDNVAIVESLRSELPHLKHIHYFDAWKSFVDGNQQPCEFPVVSPLDPALVVYTSGTTGQPKGVVLSHKGIVNNAKHSAQRSSVKEGSVWLNTLPMFHVGGSVTMTLGCLSNLGTQVVLPGFDPELMLRCVEEDSVNITMAVPTMLNALFEHPLFASTDFSSLELMVTGGTTIPPEIITETKAKLGVDMQVIFGQSEAGGVMAQTCRGDSQTHLCESVGIPLPFHSMKIISTESSDIVPVNTIGEICVRSDCTMKEYLDMPDKTAEAVDNEGWVHTGDLGQMTSEGYVQITGRLKDMIIRGGENIYPREIEDKLIEHKDIAEVAVFGVPDEKWGEKVVGAIRLESGALLDADALMDFLDQRIARHKIPKDWVAVDSMPINASGKIQKFLLAEQYVASLQVEK